VGRFLTILEVSQKQSYIFSSNMLRDNAARSLEIQMVTSNDYFSKFNELYRKEKNLVYSGGGHAVLQFDNRDSAIKFVKCITSKAMLDFPGMEMFSKTLPYDENITPGENLRNLMSELEKKKALRAASFRQLNTGFEKLNPVDHRPLRINNRTDLTKLLSFSPPNGFVYPSDFSSLTQEDPFIGVIHADGNAMGKRIEKIYEDHREWNDCRAVLDSYSQSIQSDFEAAFSAMVERIIQAKGLTMCNLPIRPVILAGDDVCFVTSGSIALESARILLEELSKRSNIIGGSYAACAGVAIVHKKYPFHQAYQLAEHLCDNAKEYGSKLDPERRISLMDWHIEFGQLKTGLSQIRADYQTEDGNLLELRPVVVVNPEAVGATIHPSRTYSYFQHLCMMLKMDSGSLPRSKLKELRTAMKQGCVETQFALQDGQISHMLSHAMDSAYQDLLTLWEVNRTGNSFKETGFVVTDEADHEKQRSLYFDSIEMMDHCEFFEEVLMV